MADSTNPNPETPSAAVDGGVREAVAARRAELGATAPVETAVPVTRQRPTIWYASTGADVLEAQRLLAKAGFYSLEEGEGDLPGYFDAATEMATRAFQSANGLNPSAVIDATTWAALTR